MAGRRILRALFSLLLILGLATGCQKKLKPVATGGQPALRPPAAAGLFYPKDPAELQSMVGTLLSQARSDLEKKSPDRLPPREERVVGILVPHAGYVFSGLTAAYAFATLEGRDYGRVVLIGSPHRMAVLGATVFCGPGFRIPTGTVSVDTAFARTLADASPLFSGEPAPHAEEHSLEVQLPFLASVLKNAHIVPILVMGDRGTLDSVAHSIIEAIQGAPGGFSRTLIVISSDLAHYPSAKDARASDGEILSAFCSLDPSALLAADRAIMARKTPNLDCSMCGLDAAYVGLQVARAAGADRALLLDSRTSADAGTSEAAADRVVGYGSVLITGRAGAARATPVGTHPSSLEPLNSEEKKFLLAIARKSIEGYLKNRTLAEFTAPSGCPHLLERRGCFVTLSIRPSAGDDRAGDRELRGCIGTHVGQASLVALVPRMALESAFGDPRFPPLSPAELGKVAIEISVYRTGVLPILSPGDFVVGRHGIILKIGDREATFLPHVATEQKWDRIATLENLSMKAGLPRDAWKRKEARFFVYETETFSE